MECRLRFSNHSRPYLGQTALGRTSPARERDTNAAPASRGEIFVVDDDAAVRQVLCALFGRAGYQLTCFAEGESLLAVSRTQTPVCIILDVHIPGRSGIDILKQLESQDYPAPIFVMSGQGDIAMAVDAIKHGALDFVEKPFRGSEVVQRVQAAVEAWAQRRNCGDAVVHLFNSPAASR